MKVLRPRGLESKPLVSVVIPCYNYGHFLPAAVGGVLSQPGVSVEIIIVDDASPDGSLDIARQLAVADPRISVVAHEQNQGHIATYNDGLGRATGDYVVLLSADDALAPGALARSAALMEAHPNVGLVYGYAPAFETDTPVARTRVRSWSIWKGEEWIQRICSRGTNLITNPEAMLRRSVMDQLGGYDDGHPQAADMLLWMQAATLGDVGRINGPDQAFYRVHGNNMHLTDFKGIEADFTGRTKVFDVFFSTHGHELHAGAALRARARKALVREARRAATVASHSGTSQRQPDGLSFAGMPVMRRPYLALDRARWSWRWRVWRRYGL